MTPRAARLAAGLYSAMFLFALAASAAAESLPVAVPGYAEALEVYRRHADAPALERLYSKARVAARELGPVLEKLNETDYAFLVRLGGIKVHRGETVYAVADHGFSLGLARAIEDSAAVAFFELHKHALPDDVRPRYLEPVTDYSVCTRYGNGTLVELYRRWWEFRSHFPGRYAEVASQSLKDVEAKFTKPLCVCAGKETVLREFQLFIHSFPDSALGPALRTRLPALERDDDAAVRYFCRPG
jgi:hypothetical protein